MLAMKLNDDNEDEERQAHPIQIRIEIGGKEQQRPLWVC